MGGYLLLVGRRGQRCHPQRLAVHHAYTQILTDSLASVNSPPVSLGLRPLRKVFRITKLAAGSPAVEAPVDPGAGAIDAERPGAGFAAQGLEVRDSAAAQALTREQADFDLRLVEPTAVDGRVVHGEALPELAARRPAIA